MPGDTTIKKIPLIRAGILHIISAGQSLSLGARNNAITLSQKYNNLMFNGGTRPSEDGIANPFSSLVPLVESNNSAGRGETPLSGLTEMIVQQIAQTSGIAYNQHDLQLLGSCPGQGAQQISVFAKPKNLYNRLINHVTQGKKLSNELGKTYAVDQVFWTQGESDYSEGTSKATYLKAIRTLQADWENDIKGITGQSGQIPFITYQMACHNNYGVYPNIALALGELGVSDEPFYLATPLYFLEHTNDNLHLTSKSSRILGAYYGYVSAQVSQYGVNWKPLHPKTFLVQDNLVEIVFHLPTTDGMMFDTTTISNPGNFGFNLTDRTGTPVAISSVTIVGKDRIRIVAASAVTEGYKLTYAINGSGTGTTNRSRGNLRNTAGDKRIFDPTGTNYKLHDWCIMFEKIF